jgi:signal transduction histidine kinase
MNPAAELKQELTDHHRPALFFTLDRGRVIGNFMRYGSFIDNIDDNAEGGSNLKDFLNLNTPDIKDAIDRAFDNVPSQIHFKREFGDKVYHCDLYCFPGLGGDSGSIGCFLADRGRDEKTANSLKAKIERLNIINQAVRAFAETTNLNEILRIILLAVTSGPGLGFNRGFIFLSDESGAFLHGCLATGPSSPREAGEIWRSLSENQLSLDEILRFYRSGESPFDTYVNELVTSLKIPINENPGLLLRSYRERRALVMNTDINLNEDEIALKSKLGAESLAVAPLVSRGSWLGVIITDNLITKKPISSSDLQLLEIFARYASDAIENTQLYGSLQRKIEKLKEANQEIIRTRENLIRSEKLTGISKMVLEVAHEIRNPLTVIGGYANAKLRKIVDDPENEKAYGIISRQTARIENTLNRFSSIVSLSEKEDGEMNIGDLVIETLKTMASLKSEKTPDLDIDPGASDARIMIDRALFQKAMMIILNEAASISGGLDRLRLRISQQHNCIYVLIGGRDSKDSFVGDFFEALRNDKGKLRSYEISIAIEILKHYGGDLSIGSADLSKGWLTVEFPLIKEGK